MMEVFSVFLGLLDSLTDSYKRLFSPLMDISNIVYPECTKYFIYLEVLIVIDVEEKVRAAHNLGNCLDILIDILCQLNPIM